jgi:hypothetical protein
MEDVAELIGRLEAASGPDRALDLAVEARNWERKPVRWEEAYTDTDGKEWPDGMYYWMPDRGDKSFSADIPRYTGSIDAAMTLLSEGYYYDVRGVPTDEGFQCSAQVDWFPPDRAYGANPAIALTIACLKAHQHLRKDKVG